MAGNNWLDVRHPFFTAKVLTKGDEGADSHHVTEDFGLALSGDQTFVLEGSASRLRRVLQSLLIQLGDQESQASEESEPQSPPDWSHQLTREQLEGDYRKELLSAAEGYPDFEAMLWGVSPQPIWTTKGVQKDFTIEGFGAPIVAATRKTTGERGTLKFTHWPRFYYGWAPAS